MRRPRVLLVAAVADFKGGAETVVRNMLDNPDIEPVLATPEDGPLADAARALGVPVGYYLPTALLAVHRPPRLRQIIAAVIDAFRCAARLRNLARAHRCDIVHTHGLKPHALAVILRTVWRVPTVVHMHDIPYSVPEKLIWRLIAPCVTRMILVSRPCFPAARLPRNVLVIPNGIIPNQAVLEPKAAIPVPLRIGFVGRFTSNKGMDLLLDWVSATIAAGLEVRLSLRGRADPDVPEYWEHIQTRIRDEGLSDIVRHEGWLPRAQLYDDLDVLMVPSNRPDPGPLVVTEAMSAGVIVLGYPAGGIPFALQDGDSGLLIGDAREVGTRLAALVADPHAFARMRERAHARVLTTFGIAKFHKEIAALYHATLGWQTP